MNRNELNGKAARTEFNYKVFPMARGASIEGKLKSQQAFFPSTSFVLLCVATGGEGGEQKKCRSYKDSVSV